jgi:hypothetical protein
VCGILILRSLTPKRPVQDFADMANELPKILIRVEAVHVHIYFPRCSAADDLQAARAQDTCKGAIVLTRAPTDLFNMEAIKFALRENIRIVQDAQHS